MYTARVVIYCFKHCKPLSCLKNSFEKLFKIDYSNPSNQTFNYNQTIYQSTMGEKPNLVKPPELVRGMTTLDKTKFDTALTLPILNIRNVKISEVMPHIKKYAFKMRHLKPLQPTAHGGTQMCVLLNPEKVQNWCSIEEPDRAALEKLSVGETDLSSAKYTITYDNYHANEIFKSVLPVDQEGFSSFSQIGHIVHLNLREHLIPYKSLIGQVLLDKIPNTRTVINKVDMIDNTYRNFEKELLCGVDDMMVNIKENQCSFEFDFSKIYWNPRLSTEHERIVKMLKPNDVLFDVFAGVGPFSIPAAKKSCIVFANDLNPDSYKWLNHNLRKNKIALQNIKTYNKDGRDFILEDFKTNLIKYINKHNVHIVMNLPALAVEFLSAFCNLYKASELAEITNPPIVHVYCFAKGEDYVEIAKKLVNENIGFDISKKTINIFRVRTVSSMKEMMRVSFKLDKDILIKEESKRKHDNCDAATETAMGKNKPKQKKNAGNISSAKNIKLKSKAKPVNSQLKRINIQNKSKTVEIDKQFVKLQDKVRKGPTSEDTKNVANIKPLATKSEKDYLSLQKKSQKALDDLNQMQLS